jgi:hypothetical protein
MLRHRRAEMKAFWILTTGVLSLALGLTLAAAGLPALWGAAGVLVLAPGVAWPRWFQIGISAWNRGTSVIATALRAYVLKVCYYVLFGAMGQAGSSLDLVLEDPRISRWIPRAKGDGAIDGGVSTHGWPGDGLRASARFPGKIWMLCLVPVLSLLVLLRDEHQDSVPPGATYTLY